MSSPADIAIYGGAAGGGKTFGLLMEPARHFRNPQFGGVIFRRTYPQVMSEGGLWDTSQALYRALGGRATSNDLTWTFPSGAKVKFAHMQHEAGMYDWQGSQIPYLAFDEFTHFTERVFWYMLSRNRSTCGVRPYLRASCNPDAESWIANLIAWWLDADTGLARPERAGIVRWLARLPDDQLAWADSRAEMAARHPDVEPLSFTFIPATIYDNRILLARDPGYLAKLKAMPLVDRERLLGGNWKVRTAAGKLFNRDWFETIIVPPQGGIWCRFWDFAATAKKMGTNPDSTAGVLMQRWNGRWVIRDVHEAQVGPAQVERDFAAISRRDAERAAEDGAEYRVRWEIEPGSAAIRDSQRLAALLAGLDARGEHSRGDKVTRAKALAAQAEARNVQIVRAGWNERLLSHLHHQPDLPHDDLMDAAAGAFNDLASNALVIY